MNIIRNSSKMVALLLVLGLILSFFNGSAYAAANDKKNILIINSYDSENPWTKTQEEGISKGLASISERVSILHEYMDSKHKHSFNYDAIFASYLAEKYKETAIDLIITTDDYATLFVEAYRATFVSQEVPVVFSGVNDLDFKAQNYVGVYERVDIKGTVEIIKSIHGEETPIMLVTDKTISSVSITKTLLNDQEWLKDEGVELLIENDYNLIKPKLNQFKDGAVIFLLFNEDVNANHYTYFEGLEIIRKCTDVPIYSVWDFYMGQGIMGGSMITEDSMGVDTVNLVKRLINGDEVSSLDSKITEVRYVMDYQVLTHYGIDFKTVKDKAIIVNKPNTFWNQNYQLVVLLTVLMSVFIIVVILLINSIRQKNLYYKVVNEHKNEILDTNQKLEKKVLELQADLKQLAFQNKNMVMSILEFRKKAGFAERLPFILHEINASLSGIHSKIGYLEAQSERLGRNESKMSSVSQFEELNELLSESLSQCEINLENIVQLVGATKTCFSDLSIEDQRNYKMKGFVDAFWLMMKPTIKRKKVSLQTKIPEEIGLFGNPGDFLTLLAILFGNSIRHGMKQNDDQELKIEIEAYASQHQVHFVYRDDGEGCDTESLEKALTQSIEDLNIHKSGIGLFQLNDIVIHHLNGTVSISGDYSEGIQVRINIPKAGEHNEQ